MNGIQLQKNTVKLKVYSIDKCSVLEREILMLINSGVSYIAKFEETFGIVDVCNDIEILYSNNLKKVELFFIVKGSSNDMTLDNSFIENGAKEITLEELKTLVSNIHLSGRSTVTMIHHISFKVELKLLGYRVWKTNNVTKHLS